MLPRRHCRATSGEAGRTCSVARPLRHARLPRRRASPRWSRSTSSPSASALYGALALREVYYGHSPILWGVLWDAEGTWFPFVALVTALVFWQGKLYAERERRAGFGRVVSSLVIVALLVLAFGLGTGHDFATFGLIPTALVLTADRRRRPAGELRDDQPGGAARARRAPPGDRRRRGRAPRPARPGARLGPRRDRVRVPRRRRQRGGRHRSTCRCSAASRACAPCSAPHPADEVIVTDSDYSERELLQIVEHAHRSGVKVRIAPKTTELLVQRGEYVPGQGLPLFELRPPVFAGTDWAVKRIVRPGGQRPRPRCRPAALDRDRGGDQAHLARARLLSRSARSGLGERTFGMFKFRTMVRRTRPSGRPSSSGTTRPTARCSRSATIRA